jgi:hypothetical protein
MQQTQTFVDYVSGLYCVLELLTCNGPLQPSKKKGTPIMRNTVVTYFYLNMDCLDNTNYYDAIKYDLNNAQQRKDAGREISEKLLKGHIVLSIPEFETII